MLHNICETCKYNNRLYSPCDCCKHYTNNDDDDNCYEYTDDEYDEEQEKQEYDDYLAEQADINYKWQQELETMQDEQ